MQLALLGLGLIGGSVARAIRRRAPGWTITGWTPSGAGPDDAMAAGVLDRVAADPESAIADADLVVLAGPPLACIELAARLGANAAMMRGRGATVTDVVSTKAHITLAAAAAGLPFVGGHPMAGRDTSGFEAATDDLFAGRPWVVTEPVGGGDAERVIALADACGGVVVRLEAAEHDRLVAAISHLPLLTSVALVEAVGGAGAAPPDDWEGLMRLGATGWRDTTRLARGDVAMGTGIAATNREAIAERLRAYRTAIDGWIALLEAPAVDVSAVEARLAAARSRLEEAG